jgi:hypothetical protein
VVSVARARRLIRALGANMPHSDFIFRNSRFFENLLEHRFLFDLGRHLVMTEEPQLLNVLKSEVDAYGFDFVLSVADRSVHVQMKTRSGAPPPNPYNLSEALWRLPNACSIWMLYEPTTLEPSSYFLLGFPMLPIESFMVSERPGYRKVRMRQANHHRLSLAELAELLFPRHAAPNNSFNRSAG